MYYKERPLPPFSPTQTAKAVSRSSSAASNSNGTINGFSGSTKKFMPATAAIKSSIAAVPSHIDANGTAVSSSMYATYFSQNYYPGTTIATSSSMCSAPASAAAAAAMTAVINGHQGSVPQQQQNSNLKRFHPTNSSTPSYVPIDQSNGSASILNSAMAAAEYQAALQQQQVAANFESNSQNNLIGYMNNVYCPSSAISYVNNNMASNAMGLLSDLPFHSPSTFSLAKMGNSSIPNQSLAYEGLPIFLVPQASTLSASAFQRATEFKLAQLTGSLMSSTSIMTPKIDTSKHFHVFVGDLSPEVNNEMLKEAFDKCGNISEAKVIRDPQSLKPRGYGFVSFPNKEDAQKAIDDMNGVMVGRRAVRTNWASRRAANSITLSNGASEDETINNNEMLEKTALEKIMNSTDSDNTTVYVGNLNGITINGSNNAASEQNKASITEEEIREAFKRFGKIKEIRLFTAQNYGFVIFVKKECAAVAILEMNGKDLIPGRHTVKCSWGRASSGNIGATVALQDNNNTLATTQLIAAQLAAAQNNQSLVAQAAAAAQNVNALLPLSQQSNESLKQWQACTNSLPYLQQQAALQQMIAASNLAANTATTSVLAPLYCTAPQFDATALANSIYAGSQMNSWHT